MNSQCSTLESGLQLRNRSWISHANLIQRSYQVDTHRIAAEGQRARRPQPSSSSRALVPGNPRSSRGGSCIFSLLAVRIPLSLTNIVAFTFNREGGGRAQRAEEILDQATAARTIEELKAGDCHPRPPRAPERQGHEVERARDSVVRDRGVHRHRGGRLNGFDWNLASK